MDGGTIGTFVEILRVIKFVMDTENFRLKIRPKLESKNWNSKVFCDSDWDGVPETRISVTGFIVYLRNVPGCWRSKIQRGVILLSSEAEYIVISEGITEIKFMYFILPDIGIDVSLPIVVKTVNIGAVFTAQNVLAGIRTYHVDTWR
jgi:hypothetical protein